MKCFSSSNSSRLGFSFSCCDFKPLTHLAKEPPRSTDTSSVSKTTFISARHKKKIRFSQCFPTTRLNVFTKRRSLNLVLGAD